MIIIGENINASRQQMCEAIASKDSGFIQKAVKAQEETGVH